MLELLLQWYRRRFTDPQVITLLVILLAGFCILYFFSGILAPLLAALGLFIRVANCPLAAYWLFTILGGQYRICAICQYHAVSGICRGTNGLAARD